MNPSLPHPKQIWVPRVGKAKPKLVTHVTVNCVHAVAYPIGRRNPSPSCFSRKDWRAWCERYEAILEVPSSFSPEPELASPAAKGRDMFSFIDYVISGETIYFAVHAKYADRLSHLVAAISAGLVQLHEFRLLFMVFSDRPELLHLCDEASVDDLRDVGSMRRAWRDGGLLDPVIGVMLSDHAAVRERERPTLFIYSDGNVITHWNPGILTQMVNVVWLHEPTSEKLLTPWGERRDISLSS